MNRANWQECLNTHAWFFSSIMCLWGGKEGWQHWKLSVLFKHGHVLFFFFSKFPETKAQWEHKKPYQSTLPPAKILLGHSTYGTLRHSSPSQHASSIRTVAPFQMPLVHFPFVPTSRQSARYFTTNQTRQTKPASTKELPSVLFPFSTAQTQTICKTQKGMLYYMKPNSLKRGLISGQKGYELLEMQMLHICHSRSQTKPRYNVLVVCMQFL